MSGANLMDRKATYTRNQFILIICVVVAFTLILLVRGYLLGALFAVVIWSYLLIMELLTIRYLSGPLTRNEALDDENWLKVTTTRDGIPVCGRLRLQEGKAPLMICLHGWSSSTARMGSLMRDFHRMGMHTMALEYRNHGDGGDTKEWTSLKVVEDLDQLMAD